MINPEVESAINAQINQELAAAVRWTTKGCLAKSRSSKGSKSRCLRADDARPLVRVRKHLLAASDDRHSSFGHAQGALSGLGNYVR